jgi:hypothetical protein
MERIGRRKYLLLIAGLIEAEERKWPPKIGTRQQRLNLFDQQLERWICSYNDLHLVLFCRL